jgi:hypothetical protein
MTPEIPVTITPHLPNGLPTVEQDIARACEHARRDRSSVTLIAVSKTFDAGAIAPVSLENQSGKGSIMTIDLEPYASRILIFSKRTLPGARSVETPAAPSSIDISRDWKVSFSADSTPSSYSQLHSWTDDEATRYFSGAATYEKVINVSRELLEPRRNVDLDFGEAEPVPEQQLRSGMQTWLAPPVREAAASGGDVADVAEHQIRPRSLAEAGRPEGSRLAQFGFRVRHRRIGEGKGHVCRSASPAGPGNPPVDDVVGDARDAVELPKDLARLAIERMQGEPREGLREGWHDAWPYIWPQIADVDHRRDAPVLRVGCAGRGVALRPPTRSTISRMCSGVVPQQPPTIEMP